mmetsp:Transcript_36537/g.90951  ORF Transcript_36537/g.90951 Transcript_36537/m.90951 type:complete len:253 (+) Transcript_36537:42-800(+)
MEDERLVERERDFRRQVQKVYYLREEDFDDVLSDGVVVKTKLQAFNDYLEEVEEIIELLMNEQTRSEGRAKLDAASASVREKTARNKAKLDMDRKAMQEVIQREHEEKMEAAARRQREEKARQLEQLQARAALEAEVAANRSSVLDAQRKLRNDSKKPASHAVKEEYVPATRERHEPVRAQPVDPARWKDEPKRMVLSTHALREPYEDDAVQMDIVCVAGGYDREQWRIKYSQEAFCRDGLEYVGQMRETKV